METESFAQPIVTNSAPATHVLVIEDNEEHANLMRHGFQFHDSPIQAEFASTLAEARARLDQGKPDILVSELSFADGKLIDLIPDDPESEDYPIVVLTERGSEKAAVELLKAGVLDYIVKTRRKCQEIGEIVQQSLQTWERIRNIRKAEINLQQTLRLARSIMDSLPAPVGVLDAEGQLLSINEAWQANSADSPYFGDSCGVHSNYLGHCRQVGNGIGEALAEQIEKIIEGQDIQPPIPYVTEGNQPTWYSVSAHPCSGTGRAKAIVIHQDITDRKQLEVKQSERTSARERIEQLTPRERQVMELVVSGKPNKSIARILQISVKTVEMHRSNLMKRMGLGNVTDLVKLAVDAGLQK